MSPLPELRVPSVSSPESNLPRLELMGGTSSSDSNVELSEALIVTIGPKVKGENATEDPENEDSLRRPVFRSSRRKPSPSSSGPFSRVSSVKRQNDLGELPSIDLPRYNQGSQHWKLKNGFRLTLIRPPLPLARDDLFLVFHPPPSDTLPDPMKTLSTETSPRTGKRSPTERPRIRSDQELPETLSETMWPNGKSSYQSKKGRSIMPIMGAVWPSAALGRNEVPTTRVYTPREKISHHDQREHRSPSRPSCSCSDLRYVALVAVMRCKRNESVSFSSGHNIYQFPSHADSDMTTTLRRREVSRLPRCSGSPCEKNSLPRQVHEPVRKLSRAGTTPRQPNSRVMSIAAILPGIESKEPETAPLQAMPAATATPLVQFHTRTSASMPRELRLNTLLCSLLLGLMIASSGAAPPYIILGSLAGLSPVATANHFALKNGYGTVEARYHLTAYDCSDPSEVQAYSSVPASHCSTRATPVQKDRPMRFHLLQKEKKRYLTAHVCFLSRRDIRYNC